MKTRICLCALAIFVGGASAAWAVAPKHKRASPHHVKPQAKTPPVAISTAAVPAAAPIRSQAAASLETDDAILGRFGAALREGFAFAPILEVLPLSHSEELGLRAEDRLAFLDGSPILSATQAARAWNAWKGELRLWAVVRRDLSILSLETPLPEEQPLWRRGPKSLSALEDRQAAARLKEAEALAEEARNRATSLSIDIPAHQAFWIRFPEGIKKTVATGDVLQGEVTMAVAADANLDFLCLPPHSLISGKVLEAATPAEGTRTLRIRFFKALLTGGHTVTLSARITDASGEQPTIRVSPGGTLVIGEPVVIDPKQKKKTPLVRADERLRLELEEPATITEPPQFYAAGPGAWIKTLETETGRSFEVTHVIAGRSAEKEGLRVGDILTSINGRSSSKLEFEDALAALYGKPGSFVKVVAQKATDRPRTLKMKRGVFYRDGVETPAPLPFDKPAPSAAPNTQKP